MASTDPLVNRLIIYTINNGALTSITSITIILFLTLQPDNLIYASVYLNLANVYSSSLLSTLNSRKAHRQHVTIETIELGTSIPWENTNRIFSGESQSTEIPELDASDTDIKVSARGTMIHIPDKARMVP
ncbi:hypothetical protein VNI00_013031 [Paramarasmius palmivorus]|uniref:DUF6534 domain-containing protein n=1 Tax=Paramarasmius palmivorus TaxID=297713 RepID=A0AAW0C3K3_9AGAR